MSIEVRVPEEIKDYKESIVAGLSIRQLACGAIALGCGIPTFLLMRNINNDVATYCTMAVTVPAFCVGFIKKNGYTFEKYIKIKFKAMFGRNRRSYETKGDLRPIEVEEYREIFQKEAEAQKDEDIGKNKGGKKIVKKKRISAKTARESEIIEITAQSDARKRKAAYKAIKNKERVYRAKKQAQKKETPCGSGTEELPGHSEI